MKSYRTIKPIPGRHPGANLTAGLGAVLLMAGWIVFAGISSGFSASANKWADNWYLRMGQWRADIRTLAACAAYVVRGDSATAGGS